MQVREWVQWGCEVAGIAAAAAGLVLIGAGLGGAVGAGLALLPVGGGLVALGNIERGAH